MIKTNEIRVGNKYSLKRGKGWIETIITEEIMGKIFSDDSEYALDDFEPIILTPEALKMYGYEYKDMMFGDPDNRLQYWRKGWFIIERGGKITLFNDKESPISVECKHLHQLQNLVSDLLGTEMNLNPIKLTNE